MALGNKSLFLYNYTVTAQNSSIDFKADVSDSVARQTTLTQGYYSLTSLMIEVARALAALDSIHTYTVTADRSLSGGTQNRITIASSGSYFQLLFASGPRTASTSAPLLGFNTVDQTGSTTYTGNFTTGTALIPDTSLAVVPGYNYLSPTKKHKVFGTVNVSASGLKEAIVFNIQKFWQVEFRYQKDAFVEANWIPFLDWAIQQKRLEFTPDISQSTTLFEGTIESTDADGKGLAYDLVEMLPELPNVYRTGLMKFRTTVTG